MKTILRFSGLAVVLSVALGLSSAIALGQNLCDDADGIAVLDSKIRDNYNRYETVEIAFDAAKEFLKKYGDCPQTKPLVEWFKPQLPNWEKQAAARREFVWRQERVEKFNNGITNTKFQDVYAAGGELIRRYPDNVQYLLPLGLIGLYESYKNNFKYNDDSIRYAKLALAKLKSGTAEPKKDEAGKPRLDGTKKPVFGTYQFERNAEEAISELTYALGYMLYHGKKDKRAGLLYYYETSQTPGPYKNEPRLYATIGQYYRDESAPIGNDIVALIKRLDEAKTDEDKQKIAAELKSKEALYNGYLERTLDAFSRAYKFSDEKIASEKVLKDQMLKLLQDTLGRRAATTTLDKWIAKAEAMPLPDPTSAVEPVYDPEPAAEPEKPAATKPGVVKRPATVRPGGGKAKPATTRKSTT